MGQLCEVLRPPGGIATLESGPGMGATTVAGAVASRLSTEFYVFATRLAGAIDAPHAVHMLGRRTGTPIPGDLAAVGESLAEHSPGLVLLDDADHPDLPALLERLNGLSPETRFLLVRRPPTPALGHPPSPGHVFSLPALPTRAMEEIAPATPDPAVWGGSPQLAVLCKVFDVLPTDLGALLDRLPAVVLVAACYPGGIPVPRPAGLPQALLLPSDAEHLVLRRAVADILLGRRPIRPSDAAATLAPSCEGLLELAEGGEVLQAPDPRDMAVLHRLAVDHADPVVRARAAASLARCRIAAGQATLGRVWFHAPEGRPDVASPLVQALLAWAEGDALLADGEVREARVSWEAAATQLRKARAPDLLARLHRRAGSGLLARRHITAARDHFKEGLVLARQVTDPTAEGTCLAGLAETSLADGQPGPAMEHLSKGATSAGAGPDGAPPFPFALANAVEAMQAHRWDDARRHLDDARRRRPASLIGNACLAHREGDLALRTLDAARALDRYREAARGFASLGERVLLAAALRGQAAAAAIDGDPSQSLALFDRAIRECTRAGDLRGLSRTLRQRARLEAFLGETAFQEEIIGWVNELEQVISEEERSPA